MQNQPNFRVNVVRDLCFWRILLFFFPEYNLTAAIKFKMCKFDQGIYESMLRYINIPKSKKTKRSLQNTWTKVHILAWDFSKIKFIYRHF